MSRNLLTITVFGALLVSTIATVHAQTPASEMNFGTARKLRTCPDRTQPGNGPIGVKQAMAYVACYYEDRSPYDASVWFVDVLKLQIAPTTREVLTRDIVRWPQIDQNKPIYILQGSVVVHTCWNLNPMGSQRAGSNCTRKETPNAIGTCWQDRFASWFCFLGGPATREMRKQPAPK
jgi:hypothetical protein